MTSEPAPPASTPRASWRRWLALACVIAVCAGGLGWWLNSTGKASDEELDAKAKLAGLGALVVMDVARVHVNSVNLSTLKSPSMIDEAVALLPALPYLNSLNVSGTTFGDAHAETAGQLDRLQDLVLNGTQITDAGVEKLRGLARLKAIYLVDTAVTSASLASIGELGSLNILDITGTKVSGNLAPLGELSNLNWLVAQRLTLDETALATIAEFPALTRLTLREATVPDEALSQLKQSRPGLTIDR